MKFFTFFPESYPAGPPRTVLCTLWLSITPATVVERSQSRSRTCSATPPRDPDTGPGHTTDEINSGPSKQLENKAAAPDIDSSSSTDAAAHSPPRAGPSAGGGLSTTAAAATVSGEPIPRPSDRFRSVSPDAYTSHERSWSKPLHPPDVASNYIVGSRIGAAQ